MPKRTNMAETRTELTPEQKAQYVANTRALHYALVSMQKRQLLDNPTYDTARTLSRVKSAYYMYFSQQQTWKETEAAVLKVFSNPEAPSAPMPV